MEIQLLINIVFIKYTMIKASQGYGYCAIIRQNVNFFFDFVRLTLQFTPRSMINIQ